MKCYKDVKAKEIGWKEVAIRVSLYNYIESELLGPRGAFLAAGYDILPVFYAERI